MEEGSWLVRPSDARNFDEIIGYIVSENGKVRRNENVSTLLNLVFDHGAEKFLEEMKDRLQVHGFAASSGIIFLSVSKN